MIQRTYRRAIRSGKSTVLLPMLFSAVFAVLFVVPLMGAAPAAVSPLGGVDIIYGEVTAIDTSHGTPSLTLQSSEWGEYPTAAEVNIFVNEDTAVKVCDTDKSLNDLKVGSNVQITYSELAGLAVADFIYQRC